MRDYIFRGKKVDGNRWVEGSLWVIDGVPQIYQRFTEEDEVEGVRFSVPIGGFWHIVHPESVGQYTGMNDKNGRKIFEGDIIRLDEYVKSTFDINDGVVKYGWGGFYIGDFSTLNSLNALATFDGVLRGEVIGTVFENADLLEG